MKPRVRALAYLSLVPLFGCVGFCDGPSVPEVAECDTADPESSFDTLEVSVRREIGGQGSEMMLFDVTFLGADPPTCADIEWDAVDPESGLVVASGPDRIETTEIDGGRRTRTPIWRFWPSSRSVRVEVRAHGHEGVGLFCEDDAACPMPDAGP